MNDGEDKVQLHVDVPRHLWKRLKLAALDKGTLAAVVVECLEEKYGVPVKPKCAEVKS